MQASLLLSLNERVLWKISSSYLLSSSLRMNLCFILTTAKFSSISVSVEAVDRLLPTTVARSWPVFWRRVCCSRPPSVTFWRASMVRAISRTSTKVSMIARVVWVARGTSELWQAYKDRVRWRPWNCILNSDLCLAIVLRSKFSTLERQILLHRGIWYSEEETCRGYFSQPRWYV